MNLYKVIVLFLMMVFIYSCEPEDECKYCEVVTYDIRDGREIRRESAIEYCGFDLEEKENNPPSIFGYEEVVWECE